MKENEIKIKEEKFIKELNVFRHETENLIRCVYCHGALVDSIVNIKTARKSVNKNAKFWNSVLYSFTDSMFISLGRMFDVDNSKGEKTTIHTLFKHIDDSKEIFSKERFSERWASSNVSMLNYKDKYMEGVYEMSKEDWKKLKKYKSSLNNQYEDLYKPIRTLIAHRVLVDNEKIRLTMDKVPVREMEKFCTNLRNLYDGLWQLYHNGRGPVAPLKTGRYSSKGFSNKKYKKYQPGPISYQYSQDTKNTLLLLIQGEKFNQRLIKQRYGKH